MSSVLVVAMTSDGVKALEVPNGSVFILTFPISHQQFLQFDITGDDERMVSLLRNMSVREVRDLFHRLGAPDTDLPRKARKDALITRFIRVFNETRLAFDTQHPELREGGQVRVVEVSHDMNPDQVLDEVRRQVPELAQASTDTVRATVASAVGGTTSFSGRGYKLGEETKDDFANGTGMADFKKHHIKPEMTVMFGEEGDAKEDYLPDTSGKKSFIVELTEATAETKGQVVVKLEGATNNFDLMYNFGEKDTIGDIIELIEANTNLKKEQMVLFYKGGGSYFQNWEPIMASLRRNDYQPEFLLCVRALGGGRGGQRPVKKPLTKQEKLTRR